tara:strand:- start:11906 stop:12811 length:906 start_codon:yes stop_codon:yes gene_type:complete
MDSIIKIGSKDATIVKQIQKVIGVPIDGVFGPQTRAFLIRWQSINNLVADGIVGPKTFEAMGVLDTDQKQAYFKAGDYKSVIQEYHLPLGEYIKGEKDFQNDYLILHHTAGGFNPYRCIDHWAKDRRGRVATEFVIGGQSIKNNNSEYDGVILQAFPTGCQGWHLGKIDSYYMNRHSVGIEICSMGYLTEANKTYVGSVVHDDQICVLDEKFRNKDKWHRYSNDQIESCKDLILFISERDGIDLSVGLIDWIKKEGPTKAFAFKKEASEGKVKGLLTHTNVRKDKMDCFPQPEFIDMLLSI